MTIASAALLLGGGGLIAVNVYAQAHEENSADTGQRSANSGAATRTTTIDCPDVGTALPDVPDSARGRVDGELAAMDSQITEAYQRLAQNRAAAAQDPNWVQNSILGPLKAKRGAALDRIGQNIRRSGGSAPQQRLDGMAGCGQRATDDNGGNDSPAPPTDPSADPSAVPSADPSGGVSAPASPAPPPAQGGTGGPVAADFQDITEVQPNVPRVRNARGASTGTFTTSCGTNANKLRNSDNVIVAPGVSNGAHHMHDYVGNQSNTAFASNDTFAGAATSCRNQGDKSTYYWPVLRLQDGTQEADANQLGGGQEGNVGKILQVQTASIKFVGSPRAKVVAMPRFLRIITGDAKAFTNGTANANAHWSCTGFENRQLTDKYPLCPDGSKVVRSFKFQSCWDGQNADSANHRTHVTFADAQGNCPANFKAIPQLTMRLVYDVPAPTIENGQVKNPYAVDGFPEQLHKPITDHDDFINVFSDQLMQRMTGCINRGARCN